MSDLHIEVSGEGPDLVLLHGWGLNVRVWDGLAQQLCNRYRIIAVDLPGHGKSAWTFTRGTPAEQAWQILSSLSPITMRFCLLGWSLGGQIALDLAAAVPTQIQKLVLVSTTPRFVEAPDWPHGPPEATINQIASQLHEDYEQTIGNFLEMQVHGSAQGSRIVDSLRQALFVHGHARTAALDAGLRTLATNDLRQTLPLIRMPALVIAGHNDRITPPSASRALAEALPEARYVEMAHAAHVPFLSHAAEFAALLDEFLLGSPTR